MVSVAIKIPSIYSEAARSLRLGSRVAIEHASLNARATETILTLALDADEHTLFVYHDIPTIQYLLQSWGVDLKLKRLGSGWYTIRNDRELWFAKSTNDATFLPRQSWDSIYVADAHRQNIEPRLEGQIVATGRFSERSHWFYQFGRKDDTELYRVDADTVVEAFPSEENSVLPKSDPRYERDMLLKDVRPQSVPFLVFARKRLKVRTDKSSQFLSAQQQKQAALQLGDTWESGLVGSPIVSFEPSKLQRRYLAKKRLAVAKGKKPWYLLLKYRRGGFSTIEQALSYELSVNAPNSYVSTIAHTGPSTSRIAKISHLYHEHDPLAPARVDDSAVSMEFANGSYFFLGTAGGVGVARGDTLQRVHGSEVSKWCIGPNQATKVEDLLAGILGAASNGEVVLETTPAGHEAFHALYTEAKNPSSNSPFTPIFLRWFDDPSNRLKLTEFNAEEIRDTLTSEENNLIVREGLDLAQIAFRREKKGQFKRLFLQEWPEDDTSCFLTSGLCFFDQESCLQRLEEVSDPTRTSFGAGVMDIWEEPQDGITYCAGTDTSEGLSAPCDLNGTAIVRRDTGKQVARIYGRYRPGDLANRSLALLERYNWPLWGIERNNHGHAVLEAVDRGGPEIYRFSHLDGGRLFHHSSSRSGWSTDSSSRPMLLDGLEELMREHLSLVNDADMLREACTFTQQKNGKFEASGGSHDDTLFMWGIAEQMRKQKLPNLEVFFG